MMLIIVLFLAAYWAVSGFLGSDYFQVKTVAVKQGSTPFYSRFIGKNIFSLDLEKESRLLSLANPTYKRVRIVRLLPDRLFVDFVERQPLAYLNFSRYLCVDEERVIFEAPRQAGDLDLPLIVGLERKVSGVKAGSRCDLPELILALNLIREYSRNASLQAYKLKKVDVAHPAEAALFLSGFQAQAAAPYLLQAKLGQENIRSRLNILSSLLAQIKKDWYNIKYIDLRFKKAVIKFNVTK